MSYTNNDKRISDSNHILNENVKFHKNLNTSYNTEENHIEYRNDLTFDQT